jgi:hypothetical protein
VHEANGNLWDFQTGWIVITTNGSIKSNGHAVMGRGVAYQATQKFPNIAKDLGMNLKAGGNIPYVMGKYLIITLPVKYRWEETADLFLIESSVQKLVSLLDKCYPLIQEIYMPRPGCGNGGLDWKDVKPVIAPLLDDRFTVVQI